MKSAITIIATIVCLVQVTQIYGQSQHFSGSWTKLKTTYRFDFNLVINQSQDNRIHGHFNWQLISYDHGSESSQQYYINKLGLTAKEYIRGHYDPVKKVYFLKGYKKEDPDNIIGLDTYRIKIDESGSLSGVTKANYTWEGRINGKDESMLLL